MCADRGPCDNLTSVQLANRTTIQATERAQGEAAAILGGKGYLHNVNSQSDTIQLSLPPCPNKQTSASSYWCTERKHLLRDPDRKIGVKRKLDAWPGQHYQNQAILHSQLFSSHSVISLYYSWQVSTENFCKDLKDMNSSILATLTIFCGWPHITYSKLELDALDP